MSYTDTLIDSAEMGECPGCQVTLIPAGPPLPQPENRNKLYCPCCGWGVELQGKTLIFTSKVGSKGYGPFRCALDHPEHQARWPKPEKDDNQEDEFTQEEILQKIVEDNPRHPGIIYPEANCVLCGEWAPHLVEETINTFDLSHSANLCCYCFKSIFGPNAHKYNEIYKSPVK